MDIDHAAKFCNMWLPSWTGNRPEELIRCYAQDAVYIDPANKTPLKGHDQLLVYFKRLLSSNPNWTWEPVEIFPIRLGFVLKWKATIPTRGQSILEHGLDIVEIANGKITRNEVYFDRTDWVKALSAQTFPPT